MRVWDLPVQSLCPKHLRGEHLEIHVMWNVINSGLKGWSKHPETLRWYGRLDALKTRHDNIVAEFKRRKIKFNHKTEIESTGDCTTWPNPWQDQSKQIELLNQRCVECSLLIANFN